MNGTKMKQFIPILFILTLLIGCAPAYVPTVVNAPLLNKQGETQIAIHTGSSGVSPQAAYALTDNWGLMINGSFADRTSDSSDNFHRHQFVEAGFGYFSKIGRKGVFEVFSGYGAGNLTTQFTNSLWEEYSDVKFHKLFLQPALGIKTAVFDGSIASRFTMVNVSQTTNESIGYFIEPVITGKIGWKNVKIVLQGGISLPLNENNIEFTYSPFIFSIGVHGNFNVKKRNIWEN